MNLFGFYVNITLSWIILYIFQHKTIFIRTPLSSIPRITSDRSLSQLTVNIGACATGFFICVTAIVWNIIILHHLTNYFLVKKSVSSSASRNHSSRLSWSHLVLWSSRLFCLLQTMDSECKSWFTMLLSCFFRPNLEIKDFWADFYHDFKGFVGVSCSHA